MVLFHQPKKNMFFTTLSQTRSNSATHLHRNETATETGTVTNSATDTHGKGQSRGHGHGQTVTDNHIEMDTNSTEDMFTDIATDTDTVANVHGKNYHGLGGLKPSGAVATPLGEYAGTSVFTINLYMAKARRWSCEFVCWGRNPVKGFQCDWAIRLEHEGRHPIHTGCYFWPLIDCKIYTHNLQPEWDIIIIKIW